MRTVLLVDDDPLVHQLYGMLLKREGFEIFSAESAAKALEQAANQAPDVMVLEIDLPDMSGLAVLKTLQQQGVTLNMPVIVTTSFTEYRVCELEAKAFGATSFLAKPYSPTQLLAEIKRVLQQRTAAPKAQAGA
jgi:DNA-binding response OmpR family regulator